MDDTPVRTSKGGKADRGNDAIVRSIARAAKAPLVALDGDLRIVGANAAFAKLFSTTKRALLGKKFGNRFGGRWGEAGLLKRIAAVRTDKARMRDVECEFDTSMGDRRLHRLNARLARASDPDDDTILLTVEDITDERRNADKIRFANAVLTAQMEGSPEGILVVDESARIVSYNRRFLEIWNVPPDLVKTKVDDPVLAYATSQTKDPEAFLARVRYLYEHPEETARDEIELADGRILDRHSTSLRDETGKYLGRVWFFRDITQQRWAEAATQESLVRVRKQLQVAGAVSQSQAVISGDVENLARLITELASAVTGCARVNAWAFNDDETELTCIDLFEAAPARHSSGMVLHEAEYRPEFAALKKARYVDANDPLTDPRTAGYVETYLKPLGITSMLDAVVHASGKNLGLLCFEHVGKRHRWSEDEIAFACRLADQIGLAMVSRARNRAEARVRASAESLAEAQSIAHVGSWSLDCETNAIEWSDEVFRIFGLKKGTFAPSYDAFLTRVHPDDRARVAAAYRESIAARRAYEIEHRIVLDNGNVRFVRERGRSTYGGDNRPVRSVGTVQDITQRKRAEEMLVASRDLLHTVVESAPVRIFWKDKDLRYLGCNASFARDAGMSRPEDLIGKDDFQMGWRDQAELYRADDRRVMDSDTPVLGYEEPSTTPDGRTTWLRTSKVPLHDRDGKVMGILGIYEDITERKRAEVALQKTTRALKVLSAGNAAVARATEERALLNEMCRIAVEIGEYRLAWVGIAQHDAAKTVHPVAIAGGDDMAMKRLECSWADDGENSGVPGIAIRTGTPQISQNITADPRVTPSRCGILESFGFASGVALPLKGRNGVGGAMMIYSADPNAFDGDEFELLVELASNLSRGISALHARAESEVAAERLQRSMETTIEVVAGTLEQRDPYTAGHQRRVAMLAEAMALRLGFSEDRIHGLRLAGIVHDLGKIYVPAEILSKPSRLTTVEYDLIKTHAQVGYDILKNVDFPWPIAKAVLQHHERMDGTGYPNGLKGDDILLEARILAVADVVESMMSHRPYRPSRGIDVALAEIERGRGTAYDPAAVDACLTLFREDGFEFD